MLVNNALIIVAVAYAISSLRGFLGVFEGVREALKGMKVSGNRPLEKLINHIGEGLSCPYCVAVWVFVTLTLIQGELQAQLASLGLSYIAISLIVALNGVASYTDVFVGAE